MPDTELIAARQLGKAFHKQCRRAGSESSQSASGSSHEIRRHIKKARAALRLLQCSLSAREFHRRDKKLQLASQQLGGLRDGEVLLDTLDETIARHRGAPVGGIQTLRRSLTRELRLNRRQAADKKAVRRRERLLSKAARPIGTGAWESKRAGANKSLRLTYRSGRAALKGAQHDRTDRALHGLRKQAKYLSLALQLLARSGNAATARLAAPFERLADALGDDHDLVLLQQRVTAVGSLDGASNRQRLLELIRRRRTALQRRALHTAERSYAMKPRQFQRRVEALARDARSGA